MTYNNILENNIHNVYSTNLEIGGKGMEFNSSSSLLQGSLFHMFNGQSSHS